MKVLVVVLLVALCQGSPLEDDSGGPIKRDAGIPSVDTIKAGIVNVQGGKGSERRAGLDQAETVNSKGAEERVKREGGPGIGVIEKFNSSAVTFENKTKVTARDAGVSDVKDIKAGIVNVKGGNGRVKRSPMFEGLKKLFGMSTNETEPASKGSPGIGSIKNLSQGTVVSTDGAPGPSGAGGKGVEKVGA